MSTTANPVAEPARPALTAAERAAALAWIERGESSLRQLARPLGLAADELLEVLTRPHVAAFLEAADAFVQRRSDIIALHNHVDAMQSLVAVVKNPETDVDLRIRAAITILRGPPPRRDPAASTHRPRGPGGPRPAQLARAQAPASPPALPAPSQPSHDHSARDRSPSANAPKRAPGAAPTLDRAAGAAFARDDRIAAQREHPLIASAGASPPPLDRPP